MKMNLKKTDRAFTLVELLVVIAIIGIVAGLTVYGVGAANKKKKQIAVDAMREHLQLAIDNYHSAYNSYPPDNALIATAASADLASLYAQTNLLFYELTKTVFNDGTSRYQAAAGGEVDPADMSTYFHIAGVRNSLAGEAKEFFTSPRTNFYRAYGASKLGATNQVLGFVVPVDLTATNIGQPNWWHYDSSSTNRHNKQSYDLWAVYSVGNTIETNGNWTR